jgi:nucleotide-binding universal stress UspA family protein
MADPTPTERTPEEIQVQRKHIDETLAKLYEQEHIKNEFGHFRRVAKTIAEFDFGTRFDPSREINYCEHQQIIYEAMKYAGFIADLDFSAVRPEKLHGHGQELDRILANFQQLLKLSPQSSPNLPESIRSIVGGIRDALNRLDQAITPRLGYAFAASNPMERLAAQIAEKVKQYVDSADVRIGKQEEQVKNTHKGFNDTIELLWKQAADSKQKAMDDLKSFKDEAEKIVSSIRTAAQDAGIATQSEHFNKLAEEFCQSARDWLLSAIIVGVLIGIYIVFVLHNLEPAKDKLDLIRQAIPRVFMVTMGFTAFLFCLRNYAGAQHNRIVNKHRATALLTFQAFRNGSADPAVKNAILQQAARSVFDAQPSGFLRAEGEGTKISQVSETIKEFTGGGEHG